TERPVSLHSQVKSATVSDHPGARSARPGPVSRSCVAGLLQLELPMTLSTLLARIRSARPVRRAPRFFPRLTALEDRTVPSTFTVLNLNDSGSGSLRAAVDSANVHPGADTIRFAGSLHGMVSLAGELSITHDLTIDGADRIVVCGGDAGRVFGVNGAAPAARLRAQIAPRGASAR